MNWACDRGRGDDKRSILCEQEENRQPPTLLTANLMAEIASDAVLEEAYHWLCVRRQRYAPNNDVWTLRWRWAAVKEQVQRLLLSGQYRFEAMDMIPESEDQVALWSSRDALVLKALALVLTRHLGPLLPKSCCHVINNGGSKAAVRLVASRLSGQRFVFRTDVKWYYSSVDHDILYAQLQQYIGDAKVLDLLWQYMHRRIYHDGLYEDVRRGIPMGCPLSPLMAAIYLKPLDERMGKKGWFYIRFMDDWVVLAPTRWQLRAAVRCVNQTMAELKLEQHPDKTFVGRISRGFDFLGYRFSPEGIVGVAYASIQSCVQRIDRLYEQGADAIRIGKYIDRWWMWVRSGTGIVLPPEVAPAVARAYERRRNRPPIPPRARARMERANDDGSGTSIEMPS